LGEKPRCPCAGTRIKGGGGNKGYGLTSRELHRSSAEVRKGSERVKGVPAGGVESSGVLGKKAYLSRGNISDVRKKKDNMCGDEPRGK